MGLEFGDVVADVVEEVDFFWRDIENLFKSLPDKMEDLLPVVEGEVCSSGHRAEILLSLLALDGGCDELPVGEVFSITLLDEVIEGILADLMAKTARA